jgi:hypothetical protein
VGKLGSAVEERFENIEKDDIAVEKQGSAVVKFGFAVE